MGGWSDGDGLAGDQETQTGTWPLDRDSDDDGIPDAQDDTDYDGFSNEAELYFGTDPLAPDSDGDGYVDGDDPVPLVAAGTLVAYVHTDHLGSTSVLTDASGTVVRRTTYQVFGAVKSNVRPWPAPATTLDPAQKYTGQQRDADTGLVYYGARWYDAQYGRFITPDTIVPDPLDPQMLNRYAYVRNSPLNATDPSGHDPLWDSGSGGWSDAGWEAWWSQPSYGSSDGQDGWDFELPSFRESYYELLGAGERGGADAWYQAMGGALYALDVRPADVVSDRTGDFFAQTANESQSETRYIAPLTITFSPGADQPLTPQTEEMVSDAIREFGEPVNINSTTGGEHSPTSRHYTDQAVDINRIGVEDKNVSDVPDKARRLQEIFNRQPNIRENFGPALNTKTLGDGTRVNRPDQAAAHGRHIHVSGQR